MLKKRVISAALAAAVTIGLAGCGQRNDYPLVADDNDGIYMGGNTTGANMTQNAFTEEESPALAVDNGLFKDDYDNGLKGKAASDDNALVMPQAGLLTAGCWSDNENWGFFSNLIASERFSYPLFGLDPTKRIKVTVKSEDGTPAANIEAELFNGKGEPVWKGVTDHDGIVYLMNKNDDTELSVKLANGTQEALELGEKSDSPQGAVTYTAEKEMTISEKGKKYENADIMFIIDSTGSMYDEMEFLQSEFTEITNRIGDKNTRYSVNFYRDEGDEYLTKCNPFSSDVKKVQTIINNEDAAGGKGQIAAVAQALDQTMNDADWSDESVKLAFLIFDAPPYKEAADSLAKSVETAASKGIRLIPVVGSGSDEDVELFGRAIAIETGGTYVFLTDDSGIGESHEEPVIGEHEVRPLVDIITDIITEYRGNVD